MKLKDPEVNMLCQCINWGTGIHLGQESHLMIWTKGEIDWRIKRKLEVVNPQWGLL